MKTNLDTTHRLIRLVLGVALVVAEYQLKVHIGLFYFGILLALTGIFGFCPLKALFKKS
ncbi:MAG TPA: DUF2892 domain-containing protein [Candidatus Omnitrophota bacterium]|nr:DUF2892 domain-containing protein [Candidatus Omnitrophota bacterium]